MARSTVKRQAFVPSDAEFLTAEGKECVLIVPTTSLFRFKAVTGTSCGL
jgi:hypothetical protein